MGNNSKKECIQKFFGDKDRELSQAEEMLNRVFNTTKGIGPSTADSLEKLRRFPIIMDTK